MICDARCTAKAASPSHAGQRASPEASATPISITDKPVEQDQRLVRMRAEQARGGLDADQRVVLGVLMRIDGVIADHPGDRAGIEHQRGDVDAAEGDGETHQAPQEKASPSTICGHQVMRFMKG